MASQNPIATYKSLLSSSSFVFLVYYRGHWCPFCMSYLTQLHSVESSISAAGGAILVVTSELEEHVAATRKASGFQGTILVDTENELAKFLKQQGTLDVAISDKKGYTKGMAQPAVLAVRYGNGVGTEKEEVLERWAIVPSLMNIGGAKDRPDVNQIWDNVQAKLKGYEPVYAKYSMNGGVALLKQKIFG